MKAEEIVLALAEEDPRAPSEIDGSPHCFFCNAYYPGEIDEHRENCVWLAAKRFVNPGI